MNSYSTNSRSNNNDSIGFQRSGDYINSDYYLNKTRNNQNKFLGRNLSEPNIHIYKNQNNYEEQNITIYFILKLNSLKYNIII